MRINPIPLIAGLLLLTYLPSVAQKDSSHLLLLKSGSFIPEKNISVAAVSQYNQRVGRFQGKSFSIIQFEHIPTTQEKKQLSVAGIELLEYIPHNAYTVSISGNLNIELLQSVKATSVIDLKPEQKMHPLMAKGMFPSWSVKSSGTLDVWICFPKSISYETVSSELMLRNFDVISAAYKNYHIIALRIALQRLTELASLPFVEYVQPAPREDKPLAVNNWTNWGRDGVKASLLNAPISVGGRNLRGDSVVIGIGDNADPHFHVDFTKRYINRSAAPYNFHGTHVAGIAAGGGIRDELRTGFAPKSTIISQVEPGILINAPAYVNDYGMVITNNSYGNVVDDCDYFGLYDLYSNILDQQAFDLPNLQTVFAAGNSGTFSCVPYPDSFGTVVGGYQSSKNVITVGNATPVGFLFSTSSKGPVRDGRIKPEIISIGSFINSTVPPPFDYYSENTGTSMAAPAVSGGLALLYQRYRQLHGGANPENGLMKTLVCNSGNDWGNAGPDYSHGFGLVNFWRALLMMENNHYVAGSVANGNTIPVTIHVPAGLAQLKVMLYWNDPSASPLASQTLVNDLDLEVHDPSSAVVLPLILDTLPAHIKNIAVNGVDHINNIEQVVIKNPAAGDYTIYVKGTAITQNPTQEYYVVYDYVPVETKLVAPIGGESYVPGEQLMIQWDSYGEPANPFTIQFSFNNGASWVNDSVVSADSRLFQWVIPAVTTDQALVRITRNGTAYQSTSFPFSIMPLPVDSLSPVQCEGYLSIDWTPVTGATDYELMMLVGDEMVSKAIVPNTVTSYTFSGLSKDSVYWVAVRPRINGHPGRRALAVNRKPDNGTCAGSISDNDLKVDAITAPGSGRQFTSTALTATTTISARIKNLDNAAVNAFNMKYSVNGGAWVTEPVSLLLAGGDTSTYNFTARYNFAAAGSYALTVVVENTSAPDPVHANDTMSVIIKQLANPAITVSLVSDFLDNMESAADTTYYSRQVGLMGLDWYDFTSSTPYGRIRPFVNTGIAYSGNRALTLDADQNNSGGTTDSLTGTFNLSPHNAVTDDIRLDFLYKNHRQLSNAANKVWIRGDDQKSWIPVYDLFANQNDPGSFKKSASIELGDLLIANGQNFSSSFQVRWGQWGQTLTADNDGGAGYTFDDVHIYKVLDDIQMISIDSPVVNSCALSALTSIQVTVRNSVNTTVMGIPVMYRIDGGGWVTETISFINGNDSSHYLFITKADLSAPGTHFIEAKVAYPSDSYHDNDTVSLTIVNSPVITSFPYLQNFEAGNGSWYTGGKNSSWEYGMPASNKIRSAASGSKAWKTRLTGNYNDQEKSYLYSPCFDISSMQHPALSLSMALDLEDCGNALCDGAWFEYSGDGKTWTRLGANGSGTNWYNKNYTGNNLWSVENYTRWHVATISLPAGPAYKNLRLRLVLQSDEGVNREGIAIDDIHIYDSTMGIYDGITMASPVAQNITGGTAWVNFTASGKLVASIQPNNQNMGNTNVQAYRNASAVRHNSNQYYLDRNITIKPATVNLPDSVTVRFYFLDKEADSLVNGKGCAGCSKPASAYELGVSKYSDPDDQYENGTIGDDLQGDWSFITSDKVIKVPFAEGYYAEFKVKNFSEFWLDNGSFNKTTPLPVQLVNFTARKRGIKDDVLVEWSTATEEGVDRFEIEVARSNRDYQLNNFTSIGAQRSSGSSLQQQAYSFTDVENNKSGVRYYRLKIINNDGAFSYSLIRPVVFEKEADWQVYPNPSNGLFNLIYQANADDNITLRVFDLNGKMVKQLEATANGFLQKITIDIRQKQYAQGMYMVEAQAGDKKLFFKLLKQ